MVARDTVPRVLLQKADGTLVETSPWASVEHGISMRFAVGDPDGDGAVDAVRDEINRTRLLFNDGEGGLVPEANYWLLDSATGLTLPDVDGDGDLHRVRLG